MSGPNRDVMIRDRGSCSPDVLIYLPRIRFVIESTMGHSRPAHEDGADEQQYGADNARLVDRHQPGTLNQPK